MEQRSFAEIEYDNKRRQTKREKFLSQMEKLIPWTKLESEIAGYYPKGDRGRKPYPLSVMLRVHFLQLFYNLSDPGMEDALYEIESMRRFSGLRLTERLPDETTILHFRHFLEANDLGKRILQEVNMHLQQAGLYFREGSIVDATIISAPTSTKNAERKRDPEMHSTKKGNQYYFGMKMHIAADDVLGVIQEIESTSANVHDVTQVDKLLHGKEKRVWGDGGYMGVEKRPEHRHRKVKWFVSLGPGSRRHLPADSPHAKDERSKAGIRAKVEHAFYYIKCRFGYSKVRYRGLKKNTNRLCILSAFANLLICKRYLLT